MVTNLPASTTRILRVYAWPPNLGNKGLWNIRNNWKLACNYGCIVKEKTKTFELYVKWMVWCKLFFSDAAPWYWACSACPRLWAQAPVLQNNKPVRAYHKNTVCWVMAILEMEECLPSTQEVLDEIPITSWTWCVPVVLAFGFDFIVGFGWVVFLFCCCFKTRISLHSPIYISRLASHS